MHVALIALLAAEPAPKEDWYGWQVMLCDMSADILLLSGVNAPRWPNAQWTAGVVLQGGGPFIHFVRGEGKKGLTSLLLRLGLPLLGAGAGYVLVSGDHCDDLGCAMVDGGIIVAGGAIGLLTAQLIDIFSLSWERADTVPPARAKWAPSLVADRNGFQLGLVGAF
jgi:hypothetical protein